MSNLRGDIAAGAASGLPAAAARTVVLVMHSDSITLLCPFFSKCDGVLLINAADGSKEFHPRDRAETICDLILGLKPGRMICGFIAESAKNKLRATGIDVRLGSCNCAVDELVASFFGLPMA